VRRTTERCGQADGNPRERSGSRHFLLEPLPRVCDLDVRPQAVSVTDLRTGAWSAAMRGDLPKSDAQAARELLSELLAVVLA